MTRISIVFRRGSLWPLMATATAPRVCRCRCRAFTTAATAETAAASLPSSSSSSSVRPPPPPRSRVSRQPPAIALSQFIGWLRQHGADLQRIDIGPLPPSRSHSQSQSHSQQSTNFNTSSSSSNALDGDWGVTSKQSAATGTTLLSIPMTLGLGTTTSPPSPSHSPSPLPSLDALLQHTLLPRELWQLHVGLRLLAERARTTPQPSFWRPYIDTLPMGYTVPLFFSGLEVNELQYAPMLSRVKARGKLLLELSALINSTPAFAQLFNNQTISSDVLAWCLSAVSSRAFSFGTDTQQKRLLPLLDMLNHSSFEPNAAIGVDTTPNGEIVKVEALRPIQSGEELRFNYARGDSGATNDDFLIDFGFVVDRNPYDSVEVSFDAVHQLLTQHSSTTNSISSSGWQWEAIRTAGLDRPYRLTIDLDALDSSSASSSSSSSSSAPLLMPTGIDSNLLAALRIALSDTRPSSDLSSLVDRYRDRRLLHDQQLAVDRRVLAVLDTLCTQLLATFRTTLDRDRTILQKLCESGKPGLDNLLLAVRYRMAKKRVLLSNQQRVRKMLQALP